MGEKIDYAKFDYKTQHHLRRFANYVKSRTPRLMCQDCGGRGGRVEPVLDYGQGPFEYCGWCEGTGYVTPHLRSFWLRERRKEKALAASRLRSRSTDGGRGT